MRNHSGFRPLRPLVLLAILSVGAAAPQPPRTPAPEPVPAASPAGYYQQPAIHGERVVFVCEDDLWEVPAAGGVAQRLTASLGTVTYPCFSPDGRSIAFAATEEGLAEAYVMPSAGGPARRLTWLGTGLRVVGWEGADIIVSSNAALPFRHPAWLWRVPTGGAPAERLPLGPASRFAREGELTLLGRNNGDPARWKRYRGGTAGEILVDRDGSGSFDRLVRLKGNLADPMILGGRVWFLSDHEGVGNLYSCAPDGSGLSRHTAHADFYARNASTDGRRIVYQCGADIWLFDPASGESGPIAITFASPRAQRARRFEKTEDYVESFDPSPDAARIALSARGKLFSMGSWDGPVIQAGDPAVRYRLPRHQGAGRQLVATDPRGEAQLEILPIDGASPGRRIETPDLGRATAIELSPTSDTALVVNHRNQLVLVQLTSGTTRVLDQDPHRMIGQVGYSPDGRWAAWGSSINARQSVIKLCRIATGEVRAVTRPVLADFDPSWDPEGRYLYFLSSRVFSPVYAQIGSELSFPEAVRPYLITLRRDTPSPFRPEPEGFGEKEKRPKTEESLTTASADGTTTVTVTSRPVADEDDDDTTAAKRVRIDFEGIEDRVEPIPVEAGIYDRTGAHGDRVYYIFRPAGSSFNARWDDPGPEGGRELRYYDLKAREQKTLAPGVNDFRFSANGAALALRLGRRVRVIPAGAEKLPEDGAPARKSGWIDLARPRLEVEPPAEWRQMLDEAWRLQRDYFWNETMSGVEWREILERYRPLVDRVATRRELADLLWEMQGELGTSHCYEMGGDYRDSPLWGPGFLGADIRWDAAAGAWRIGRIIRGDTWGEEEPPPLIGPGIDVTTGSLLLAVNARPLDRETPPGRLLVNQAGAEVQLTVAGPDGGDTRTLRVKTLGGEGILRYRDWVEANRRRVHDATGGRVGYIHVPDMMSRGYAEFHRGFLAELDRDGLIVDVRYNGGGHVSQLLLAKLALERVAYVKTRWMGVQPYPDDAPMGPMVCITNENAGSDGDIFSHNFKLMGLGPLIGRRTWGGVIGIWPRNSLVDGTTTTQPEFSFWFKDVGWGVENYGTDPDIEVDILPQDWAAGRDPQLERGLAEVLKIIEESPGLRPDFAPAPARNYRWPAD